MTILDQIVADTRQELRDSALDAREEERAARRRVERRDAHRFRSALATAPGARDVRVIAEIKAASPSAGTIVENPDVEGIARAYREGGAAAISVVVEPRYFKGSREWMARAADASGLPVIMKDFVVEPVQIFRGVAAGADAILLLASLHDAAGLRQLIDACEALGRDALVEVHDERELGRALDAKAPIVGVNNRNLRDFSVDLATSERLGRLIPPDRIRVTESGIHSRGDVDRLLAAGFNAFLVGESLLRQPDRTAAVAELVGGLA
jgi:indole-3-glycerol phosphate synthase